MFENNKDFYPTPKNLIYKMLEDVDLRKIKTILELSVGTGSIVEEIINKKKTFSNGYYNNNEYDIDCIDNPLDILMIEE